MRIRLLTVGFIVSAWMTGCNNAPARPNEPTIAIDHDTIDFDLDFYAGSYVGTKPQQSLIIRNAGIEALNISSVELSGDPEFTFEGPSSHDALTGNMTTAITVFFDVKQAKAYSGTLTIHSNSATEPDKTVAVKGTGVTPP